MDMAEGGASSFVAPKLEIQITPSDVIPIPDDPVDCSEENDRRLWIGNLDTRVTEFALLKILQKFGSLERFDFLYHKTGPDHGKPRGYCFVSYSSRQEAEKAMKCLDRKLALSKRMVVRWAHRQVEQEQDKVGDRNRADPAPCNLSSESKIRAIEMKLKNMERRDPDFSLDSKPSALPGTSKYSSTQRNELGTSQRQHGTNQRPSGTIWGQFGANHRQSGTSNRLNTNPYMRRNERR